LGYSEKIMKSMALMAYIMKIVGWWDATRSGKYVQTFHRNLLSPYSAQTELFSSKLSVPSWGHISPIQKTWKQLTVQYLLNTQSKEQNNLWICSTMRIPQTHSLGLDDSDMTPTLSTYKMFLNILIT
jgi:hypothetical protein